jgi:molybdenum cofactor cytidylyltransferase
VISAILLAAGLSHRFGSEKLQQEIGGKRLIDWSKDRLLTSAVDEVIVVVNSRTQALISGHTPPPRLKLEVNPRPQDGLSSSIRIGLEACHLQSQAVLICHADMPLVDETVINRLISFWKESPSRIVAPRVKGQQGNPVLFPRRFWSEIIKLEGDIGCKSILQTHATELGWVEMEDDRVLWDVDSESELLKLRNRIRDKA